MSKPRFGVTTRFPTLFENFVGDPTRIWMFGWGFFWEKQV